MQHLQYQPKVTINNWTSRKRKVTDFMFASYTFSPPVCSDHFSDLTIVRENPTAIQGSYFIDRVKGSYRPYVAMVKLKMRIT